MIRTYVELMLLDCHSSILQDDVSGEMAVGVVDPLEMIEINSDAVEREKLLTTDKAHAQELQGNGTWKHLWRIVRHYSNISNFDVADGGTLHHILSTLPLFAFIDHRPPIP